MVICAQKHWSINCSQAAIAELKATRLQNSGPCRVRNDGFLQVRASIQTRICHNLFWKAGEETAACEQAPQAYTAKKFDNRQSAARDVESVLCGWTLRCIVYTGVP